MNPFPYINLLTLLSISIKNEIEGFFLNFLFNKKEDA